MDYLALATDALANLFPPFLDAAFAVIALASAVSALTPTPRDDALVGRAYKIIEWLALNVGHAKEVAPNHAGGRFVAD